MAIPRNCFVPLIEAVLIGGAKRATKYVSTRETVKVTYHGKRDGRNRSHTMHVTCGSPNYAERQFIKKCKVVGEPFPVQKIQMKF